MQLQKVKEYLGVIYHLQSKGIVRGAYIAKATNRSKPTVSVALRAMAEDGFVEIRDNKYVTLTPSGLRLAEEYIHDTVRQGTDFQSLLDTLQMERERPSDSLEAELAWIRKEKAACILELLYALSGQNIRIRSTDICHFLSMPPAPARSKLKKLEYAGYLTISYSSFLSLTEKGERLAESLYNAHAQLRTGLTDAGLSEELASIEVCRLECVEYLREYIRSIRQT